MSEPDAPTLQTEATSPVAAEPDVAACENCGTALQGRYCHACGQSAHNPLQHVWHALEEVFESVWHLDGRIFRTLRDLSAPGRVAAGYLAGHRARYVPPLRLFVILSLLTFFVAHYAYRFDGVAVDVDESTIDAIAEVSTEAEVIRLRDAAQAQLRERARRAGRSPVVQGSFNNDIAAIGRAAEDRLRVLRAKKAGQTVEPRPTGVVVEDGTLVLGNGEWDSRTDPVNVPFLPRAANDWLTGEVRRGMANTKRAKAEPEQYQDAVLKTMPTMLFLLVPVFALLLKVFYLFARRAYLEHLVVALYSHAWLLLSFLAISLSSVARERLAGPTLDVVLGVFEGLLWAWMPIYLLLMQKRVYAQGWLLTLLKYFTIGMIYIFMLSFAMVSSVLIGFVRM